MKKKIAVHGQQKVDWAEAPLVDGTVPLQLEITAEEIVAGKANPNSCPLALAGQKRYDYFAVGADVVHVGMLQRGKPVRVRYRSGNFPKRYDRALRSMSSDLSKSFADCNVRPMTYKLRPPTGVNTLASKQAANAAARMNGTGVYAKGYKASRPRAKANVSPFYRGRLV